MRSCRRRGAGRRFVLADGAAGHERYGEDDDSAENLACHVQSLIMRAMTKPAAREVAARWQVGLALAALCLGGCDVLSVSRTGHNIREGNEAVLRGELQKALQHFESALDGTMLSAEAHYRLGLLYEDQLKNEVGALHHFERYLELAPQGQFATDVKSYVERLRLMIVSRLSDGPVLPAREAARLKNENLELKQRLTELRQEVPNARGAAKPAAPLPPAAVPAATPALVVVATPTPPPTPVPAPAFPGEPEVRRAVPVTAAVPAAGGTAPAATAVAPASVEAPVRTYKVQSGDTLAGIARKFYRNSGQWPKIAEANKATLEDPTKLKPGMVLIIPE